MGVSWKPSCVCAGLQCILLFLPLLPLPLFSLLSTLSLFLPSLSLTLSFYPSPSPPPSSSSSRAHAPCSHTFIPDHQTKRSESWPFPAGTSVARTLHYFRRILAFLISLILSSLTTFLKRLRKTYCILGEFHRKPCLQFWVGLAGDLKAQEAGI